MFYCRVTRKGHINVLKRRKSMKGFRHPKKQPVTGVCHLCAAEFSLPPIVLFVLSACLCMTCMRAFCLRTGKLNHIYIVRIK